MRKEQPTKPSAQIAQEPDKIAVSDRTPLKVSVVIPVRNEDKFILTCLESIQAQTYPHSLIEVLVVNGMSSDTTVAIAQEFSKKSDLSIRIIANPDGNTPCGLNVGYKNATGDIFIHFIGHAIMPPEFIEKNVNTLRETQADATGGLVLSACMDKKIVPRAIGFALNTIFSLGGVTARTGTKPQYIDNPSFAAYRKELFERFGYIDERLTRNQDYEFNQRISKAGARIYFTPEIKSYYFNRPNFKTLWKEYFNAAKWRTFMIGRFARALMPRHLAPPLLVIALFLLGIFSFFSPSALWVLTAVFGIYALPALGFSLKIGWREGMEYVPAVFLSYIVIHIAYGLGFIWGYFFFILLRRGQEINKAIAQS